MKRTAPCPDCGAPLNFLPAQIGTQIPCPACARLITLPDHDRPLRNCPDCRQAVSWRADTCPGCGSPLSALANAQATGAQKSRLVFILLAVFLGLFGVHNFYADYAGRGALQLLLTVLLIGILINPIWILFEIIGVTTDAAGVPMK